MPAAASSEHSWDFFVAHAGADTAAATQVTTLLEAGGARVFLDTHKLLPGAVWPRVLAHAQDSSAVTVILVSKHTAAAYYQLEELAEAIHLSRNGGSGHRVAPVYLEPVERLPYGLRVVHGLWALDPAGIEDAARQLLRLLPHPGDKAPAKVWSRQIPVVTEFFAGRDELLGRLAGHGPQRTSVLTQSVAGLGGVGKTTLAAALCWEQAEVTDIVWWLQADTETTVIAGLADLAVELGVAGAGSEDLAVAADGACRALEGGGRRWLLVFDNAESDTLVHRYTPKRGDGRVVVTTRRRDFRRLGPVVVVDVFDPVTAEDFLRSRVKDTNPAAAREPHAAEVARRLGGLPLALEQAGAYSPRRSFAAYLDLLDDYRLDPFVNGVPLDYQATATTTWQVSIDAAARTALLAPKIMAAFAYLAPAPVPVACFADLADHPYMAADADTNAVTAAIDVLYAYSLISIDHDLLSVHRMVRDASLRLGDRAASRFVVAALCMSIHQTSSLPGRGRCALSYSHTCSTWPPMSPPTPPRRSNGSSTAQAWRSVAPEPPPRPSPSSRTPPSLLPICTASTTQTLSLGATTLLSPTRTPGAPTTPWGAPTTPWGAPTTPWGAPTTPLPSSKPT